jgi:hypothetical protein
MHPSRIENINFFASMHIFLSLTSPLTSYLPPPPLHHYLFFDSPLQLSFPPLPFILLYLFLAPRPLPSSPCLTLSLLNFFLDILVYPAARSCDRTKGHKTVKRHRDLRFVQYRIQSSLYIAVTRDVQCAFRGWKWLLFEEIYELHLFTFLHCGPRHVTANRWLLTDGTSGSFLQNLVVYRCHFLFLWATRRGFVRWCLPFILRKEW